MSDTSRPRGRKVPALPEYHTTAGYAVACRRVSPDTPARLTVAAMRDLAERKPAVPTQRVTIGVDPRTQAPIEQDIPVPTDPAYLEAFAGWEREVRRATAQKLRQLLEEYALVTPPDVEAVAALRSLHATLGDPLDGESDRQVWLWRIVAPTSADQAGLMAFVLGRSQPSQEAIQAQKDTFRGDVSGAERVEPAGAGE